MQELPASRTIDLSHQYGCPAHMVVAYFTMYGIPHVARCLWRSDLPGTGKVELYTFCPYETTFCVSHEDWLGYVDPFDPTRVGVKAMQAIAATPGSGYHMSAAADAVLRAQAIEITQ